MDSMQSTESLTISVSLTILKPAEEVFTALENPMPFFVEKASDRLAEGKTIQWKFPEVPEEVPVIVESVVPGELVKMTWDSGSGGKNTCEFRLAPLDANGLKAAAKQGLFPGNATTLTITETGWPYTPQGREFSYRNQMGWMHMACSLKAWLEYGVNLRRGAFLHFKF
jgi:uncharacterized protein YndB with AHSA1/START domain